MAKQIYFSDLHKVGDRVVFIKGNNVQFHGEIVFCSNNYANIRADIIPEESEFFTHFLEGTTIRFKEPQSVYKISLSQYGTKPKAKTKTIRKGKKRVKKG